MNSHYIQTSNALSNTDTAAPSGCTMTEPTCVTNSETLTLSVGAVPHDPLTDESREEAIQLAGRLFLKHWARYEATSCLAAKGDADRALRLQNLLILGRSAEQVRRMEQERGLS